MTLNERVKEIGTNAGLTYSRAYNVLELILNDVLVIDTERRYTLIQEQVISLESNYKGHTEEFKEYAYYIEYITSDKRTLTNVFKVRDKKAVNWLNNYIHENCRVNFKKTK